MFQSLVGLFSVETLNPSLTPANTVIDLVDAATTDEGGETDWTFLQACTDAYPPRVDDHHCSQVLAKVVARYVIRTRINQGSDTIPLWVVDYLMDISVNADTE